VDPDFYYYGGCLTYDAAIGTNATVTVPVLPGTHSVSLNGVPSNCTVSGDTFRTVTVSDTTDVIFAVGCVFAEKIALVSSGTISIAWVDGSAVRPLTTGSAPAWAPDGSRLAYECGPNLCAINADSTGFAQITMDGAGYHHPTWSPDGLHLAFASTRDGPAELYAMAANGSGVVRLTQNVGFVGSPAWSPDGSRIVFDCAVDAGNDDLCMINADGTGFTRLTSDPARDYGAAWKPDGSTLAFATTRYGEDEVVLLSPVGGSVTRIGSGLPGFEPTWAPDGTQLALVQVRQVCDQYGCGMYNLVEVHHADGSDTPVKAGDQPAWRPHP
jgi:dipeptidyl aminopeptidase/acylaminoacyl peptidase